MNLKWVMNWVRYVAFFKFSPETEQQFQITNYNMNNERQTDRQTDRQRQRQRETEIETETDTQTE